MLALVEVPFKLSFFVISFTLAGKLDEMDSARSPDSLYSESVTGIFTPSSLPIQVNRLYRGNQNPWSGESAIWNTPILGVTATLRMTYGVEDALKLLNATFKREDVWKSAAREIPGAVLALPQATAANNAAIPLPPA